MNEGNGHVVLDVPYQGNGCWLAGALFALFLLFYAISRARSKHKAGMPVDIRATICACLIALLLAAVSLFQVLTHEW